MAKLPEQNQASCLLSVDELASSITEVIDDSHTCVCEFRASKTEASGSDGSGNVAKEFLQEIGILEKRLRWLQAVMDGDQALQKSWMSLTMRAAAVAAQRMRKQRRKM